MGFRRRRPRARKGQGVESVSDSISRTGKVACPVLLSYDQMPEWFRHESNKWILHGYRPVTYSVHASFYSLSYFHTELLNIYSHLFPAIPFLLGDWYIPQYLTSRYSGFIEADSITFSIFMLTAVTGLSLSAMYHTFMNLSQRVEHFWLRMDMLSAMIFILGDLVLGIHIVFWREPVPRNIYWSMIGVFGTLTIFMVIHPKYQGPKHRLFRALLFVAVGTSGIAPFIYGIHMFGRFLKSRYPSKFDLWGSHWIFRILVVCAAIVQLMGYLDAFDYAQANLTCSSL
ncbi:hemolysin-III family protein [Fusarium tricinctum]|uniref:Hemolysin-III family protein n=1 Tax=Fusarium tricinctum TaxID=61284 RepID=A0A8K0W578_9HYPO|nr:hemolysin-III family protein [Fusarium tricinctum]